MQEIGAITGYIDVAQVVLYVFWIFFFGLIVYLRMEDKREGFPMEGDYPDSPKDAGVPPIPKPKFFRLMHGGTVAAPHPEQERPIAAEPVAPWPGAPLEPTGNPLVDGVGPAAWVERADEVDLLTNGDPKIVPLHKVPEITIEEDDPDPRGMQVIAADRRSPGNVVEAWVDQAEMLLRYYEIELTLDDTPPAPTGHRSRRNGTGEC